MLEHIAAAIDARSLAVPDAEYAIEARLRQYRHELTAPDGGGGEVFINARLEMDVRRAQQRAGLP